MATSQALAKHNQDADAILEKVIVTGDLSGLTPAQRISHYNAVCHSLGLNPLTKPFQYLQLNNKLVLYACKDATEQLRQNRGISIYQIEKDIQDETLTVRAYARTPDGRTDVDEGVVSLKGLIGDSLANAMMKAVTKAKRRVTLSICGLGFLDESEIETIPDARPVIQPEAVMTSTEADQVVLSHTSIGLDQWKCGRSLAMQLIKVCKQLEAKGVDDETMRMRLPGVTSRKDLTPEQAQAVIKDFNRWLDTYNAVVGEVANG